MSRSSHLAGWETAASVSEVRATGLLDVEVDGTLVLLAWLSDGPRAAHGLCPHQSARLCEGRIRDGRLHCPRHQASFDLGTGTPDDRWQIEGLRLIPVRVRNGQVEVNLAAARPPKR